VKPDPNLTRSAAPEPPTGTFDPALDAGLAAAFGPDPTPGGWSQPPLLRDDPSENSPLVQPYSTEMPRQSPEHYQLLGEIARGGMGVVLKGRDPRLGRDLAFKVLKAELAGRPAAEQRFVEEAQVGGQLQHPGVVPVYDLGRFADGRPYFAMKLVKGRTLADHLTERDGPSADRGRFLQVFLRVCETIGYAHSRGVIHRDLKPSNIMVGAFGEVLVMDWGLAKVLPRGGVADEHKASQASGRREPAVPDEPTVIHTARSGSGAGSETQAGSVLGTPAFMSPEQAAGEIDKLDERADVFGLGAVLCVVLTGQPPYAASTGEAVRLMAVRGDLEDAFARLGACGADAELAELCRRCLAPKRDDRPRHAGEVAGAVAGYLAAVEARAHRAELERAAAEARAEEEANTRRVAVEKAVEERKRRRVQLALAASVGMLLLGGGAFAWWQDRQATARRTETANRERDEQNRRDRNAEAVAALLAQCEETLKGDDAAKAAVALDAAEKRAAEGGEDALADRLARCRADLAVTRDLDAVDVFRWTPVENKQPDGPAVAERYRGAFGRFGADPGSVSPEEAARRVAGSAVRDRLVAALDRWLGDGKSAGVRAVLRAVDPDPFRDAVRDAVLAADRAKVVELANRPEAMDQPPGFAAALGVKPAIPAERRRELLTVALLRRSNDLGLLMTMGTTYWPRKGDWREAAAEQVRWFQAAVAAHPGNVAAHNALGGVLCDDRRDYDGAVACFREAIRLDPKNAIAHHNLGIVLRDTGDTDGAIAKFRDALRLDPEFIHAHRTLGTALSRKGDYDGAIACFREAIRLNPNDAGSHNTLGSFLSNAKKDHFGAVACFREAIRLDPDYALAHANLGIALSRKGDVDEAIAAYREAIRLDPKASTHFELGKALRRKGDIDGAIAADQEAIRLDPTHAGAHIDLGAILCDVKQDYAGAVACFREAIRLNPKNVTAHANLGGALGKSGDLDGKIAALREVVRLDPNRARAHNDLAWWLATSSDDGLRNGPEAVKHAIQACELTGWKNASWVNTLAAAYAEAGDFDKAIEYQQKAMADPAFLKQYSPVAREQLDLYRQKKPYREPTPAPPPREAKR
jgi:tetratricopeptide (TPR) repeat protein